MKIAVFVTGWNKEYLRYLYGGLVNAQNKFGDEITYILVMRSLVRETVSISQNFHFLSLQI